MTTAPPAKQAKTATAKTLELRKLRLLTAIKTPYTADGNLDLAAYDRHMEHQVANGVEGVIVGGTTGEGHLLSWEEHLFMIAHTKAKFGDKLAVVGNTGGMSTAESAVATRKGFAAGMDCSLLINPYYGKTNDRGIVMHLESGLKYGPAIIYNVPGRTGQDIKPEVIMQIAGHEHFVGVKECMGHERIAELSKKGVACWSGNDEQCHDSRHKHGGVGVISVAANVVPGLMRKLLHEGPNPELDAKLAPLFKWLFAEPNPIGVNTLMMQLGVCEPVFRLPYTHTTKEAREEAL
jgi:4-hydroxy-tetrahydrodipicolinate synthase